MTTSAEQKRTWRKRNPLRYRLQRINRRARKRGAVGRLTLQGLEMMLDDARGHCSECGKAFGLRFRDRWVIWTAGDLNLANARIICREREMERAKRLGIRFLIRAAA